MILETFAACDDGAPFLFRFGTDGEHSPAGGAVHQPVRLPPVAQPRSETAHADILSPLYQVGACPACGMCGAGVMVVVVVVVVVAAGG